MGPDRCSRGGNLAGAQARLKWRILDSHGVSPRPHTHRARRRRRAGRGAALYAAAQGHLNQIPEQRGAVGARERALARGGPARPGGGQRGGRCELESASGAGPASGGECACLTSPRRRGLAATRFGESCAPGRALSPFSTRPGAPGGGVLCGVCAGAHKVGCRTAGSASSRAGIEAISIAKCLAIAASPCSPSRPQNPSQVLCPQPLFVRNHCLSATTVCGAG